MNFRELTTMGPVEPLDKRETVKGFLDEVSCMLIETGCNLDQALKGLGFDLGWEGTETNPKDLMEEAKILLGIAQFCMKAATELNRTLF